MNKEYKAHMEEEELSRWLQQMKGEEIEVPFERLQEGMKTRLEHQKTKYRYKGLKTAVLLIGILGGSYVLMPSVQTLAQDIIQRILGDAGLDKVLEEGYPHIEEQDITIGGYKAKIHNIYIDEQRFNMDFIFYNLPQEDNVAYDIHLKDVKDSFDEVGISHGSFFEGDEGSSIMIVGEGVKKILEQSEIQIPLVLEKHDYNLQKNTVLGEVNVTLKIPDALRQESKIEEVRQTTEISNGWIQLKQIEMAPTMMTLSFESEVEDKVITGLKDLSVENNQGEIFSENMSLIGNHNEQGGFEAFIVPSMYFSQYESFEVRAKGYLYEYKEPEIFTVRLDEALPKEISYMGKTLLLTELSYDEKKKVLNIGFSIEEMTQHMSGITIDGQEIHTVSIHSKQSPNGTFTIEEWIYSAHIPKKDSYEISFEITFLEEHPIIFRMEK